MLDPVEDGQDPALRNRLAVSPGPRYRSPTVVFFGYTAFALVSIAAALAAQRPELLLLGAPAMVVLALGAAAATHPTVSVRAATDVPRPLEGDPTQVSVALVADDDVGIVEIEMGMVRAFDAVGTQRHVVALAKDRARVVTFTVIPLDWGVLELPTFTVRARRAFGLFSSRVEYRFTDTLRVHIHEEPVRSIIEPRSFRRLVGSHVSNERADGCEIADVRPYQPGDRLKAVNWRISARNDEPWVTLRHPDRSTTVVIILDAFGAYGTGERDTLRRSVRAGIGIARLHLLTQDPVGLLLIGNGRRWIPPRLGPTHLAGMTDAMLELTSQDWADREQRRQRLELLVPRDAVVIAVSPLLNDAFSHLLAPLLARGQQVQIIEPEYEIPDDITVRARDDNGDPAVAWRLFEIEQHLRRRRLTEMGGLMARWSPQEPVESALISSRRAQRARSSPVTRVQL